MSLRAWSNGSPNKSKMAAVTIFNFGKTSINLWEYASWPCEDDHMTKSRNRKLICETSSNEGGEQKASILVIRSDI